MGFLSGSATFQRYWITADPTPELGPDHLHVLEKFQIGKFETTSLDQPQVGFLAGSHLLDANFDLEKNIVGDAMHFGVRIDTNQIPAAVRKAWLQLELLPLTADNPSGKPTKAQREEANEAVEARCIAEASSGKFRRMQQIPLLWDALHDVMYVGTTSPSANEFCIDLLERAFQLEFDQVSAGKLAKSYATAGDRLEELYQVCPAAFQVEDLAGNVTWWNGMAENFDYLGNEFLLWLWWHWETKSDTIALGDGSQVSGMFARTLTLDCPLGESGNETISATSPVALPEAAWAIRFGKQPRKAGLTLVRHDQQYDFTLQAETFAVGGAKMKQLGNESSSDNPAEDRISALRELTVTLDLLFEVFCERRIGKGWKSDLRKLREWLQSASSPTVRSPAA